MNSTPGRPTWMDRLGWPLPPMERGDRKALVERVEAGAVGGIDFLVMMVMSAGLASLGLLEDSTAVVIGAMLVAPLMGPLIGAGLALDQADLSLFRRSVWVALLGLLVGLLVSLVIGLLNPGFEPSLEIEARGNPDLLDLGIASLSGFVAAYAFGRPGVASSLAGVAIAAALVPPLCVVGIGLTNGRPLIAANSAVLLVTNLVAIILSAALAFAILGLRGSQRKERIPDWVKRSFLVLAMAALILLTPLLLNLEKKKRLGQSRPLTYPVSAQLQEAVEAYVEPIPNLSLITIARNGVDPSSSIGVMLATPDVLPAGVKSEITRLVHEVRGKGAPVRVFVLQEVPEEPSPRSAG